MKLPNFLIVGAAKSGTTSLYEYLRTHPQIFMPGIKEPAHFDEKVVGGIHSWEEYCCLFKQADGFKRVGEASVSYLMSTEAPERIEHTLGKKIDIIVVIRNPIEMAYSLWGQRVREGMERLNFFDAVNDEPRRLNTSTGDWQFRSTYITRARYAPQLQRYFDRFGRERVHVFLFEEFFKPGLPLYRTLLEVLHVDPNHRPIEAAHNKAGSVRSTCVRRILNERMVWKEPLKRIIPKPARDRMINTLTQLNRVNRPLPPMPPEARRLLWKELTTDVDRVSKQLNRDLRAIWQFDAHL